jgi:16S rRNA (guanine1207-N2)-methyltransferase
MPKAHERLAFLLAQLAAQIEKPVECWLVGPAKGGIKGALKHFSAVCTQVALKDSARHCKLYAGQLQPRPSGDQWQYFQVEGARISSLPGVFSHGRLDEGSALLLDDLKQVPVRGKRVLDAGCGAGVLSLHLAQAGHEVSAVDISATALAACRQTLADNGLSAEVFASDLLADVTGRFHAIVSNPPFHDGLTRDLSLARRLIEQSRSHLYPDGELRLVANRNLPYHDWLATAFGSVEISRETSAFRIWRARQPRQ